MEHKEIEELDGWNVKEAHPEAYAAWMEAVAAGKTTIGLKLWILVHRPNLRLGRPS